MPTQKALLIWDGLRGQKPAKVLKKLALLNIVTVSVPTNMTHFFQPLDLTINGEAKRFMKDKFTNSVLRRRKAADRIGRRQH